MPRPRLIVSFIGGTDLNCAGLVHSRKPPQESTDPGPILRSLEYFLDKEGFGGVPGDRILLLDDRPADPVRIQYCQWLQGQVARRGPALEVEHAPLALAGPTNLDTLFAETRRVIPEGPTYETIFLASPGTPAMYATLVLAAEYLKLRRPRLIESSREQGVQDMKLPYELGLRPRQRSWRAPNRQGLPAAPDGLIEGTVCSDPAVLALYAALRRVSRYQQSPAIVICGPHGSGKHHAARQMAHWRDHEPLLLSARSTPADVPSTGTVIVTDLQAADDFPAWLALRRRHPETQFVFLWNESTTDLDVEETVKAHFLAPEGIFRLPALAEREDQIALAESFARAVGKLDTKVRQRLQYPLMRHAPVSNLHELKSWISTAAAYSETPNLDSAGVERSLRTIKADAARTWLKEMSRILSQQQYVGRVPLDTLLDAIQMTCWIIHRDGGNSDETIADRLGVPRGTLGGRLPRLEEALRAVLAAIPEIRCERRLAP